MTHGDEQYEDGLAPATSAPPMKIVLVTEGEIPQVLAEWSTAVWLGHPPKDSYEIDGDTWDVTGFREYQEPDGTRAYHVSVVRAS